MLNGTTVPGVGDVVFADQQSLALANTTPGSVNRFRLEITSRCQTGTAIPITLTTSQCSSIDFNGDGLFPDDQDLVDFLSVLAGGACSTATCDGIDFNNDGLFPDDQDLVAFLSVLAGGSC